MDGLKRTNDTGGHAADDARLRLVAATLQACLRATDVLLRYGGDEFVCVLVGTDLDQARILLDRVHPRMAATPGCGTVSPAWPPSNQRTRSRPWSSGPTGTSTSVARAPDRPPDRLPHDGSPTPFAVAAHPPT